MHIDWIVSIDTFSNMTLLNPQGSNDNITYTMSEKGIAWSSDVSRYKKSSTPVEQLTPPPNWQKRYPSGYTAENLFDPSQDEHFLVWMRTSWYPTFRKLYSKYESDPLQPGTYQIQVDLSKFPENKIELLLKPIPCRLWYQNLWRYQVHCIIWYIILGR